MSLLLAWKQGLTKMPKPIPLSTRLRIKSQNIIIHSSRGFILYMLMKNRSIETGDFKHVKWPIGGDSNPVNYFFRCCTRSFWC
jgi:hypothetical protein